CNTAVGASPYAGCGTAYPPSGVIKDLTINNKITSSKDVEELASRVHPIYGLLYTISLYLSIGPMFATPRTGTVAYEIAIKPFAEGLSMNMNMEPIFLALFFG
ncbi:Branched-chain amino acid transport system II carrier protein, partial [human gut metagenome]